LGREVIVRQVDDHFAADGNWIGRSELKFQIVGGGSPRHLVNIIHNLTSGINFAASQVGRGGAVSHHVDS